MCKSGLEFRKLGRIQALVTGIHRGKIQFAHNQKLLIEQLKYFPKAAHDDGPDALAMVIEEAKSANKIGFVPLTGGDDPPTPEPPVKYPTPEEDARDDWDD